MAEQQCNHQGCTNSVGLLCFEHESGTEIIQLKADLAEENEQRQMWKRAFRKTNAERKQLKADFAKFAGHTVACNRYNIDKWDSDWYCISDCGFAEAKERWE